MSKPKATHPVVPPDGEPEARLRLACPACRRDWIVQLPVGTTRCVCPSCGCEVVIRR